MKFKKGVYGFAVIAFRKSTNTLVTIPCGTFLVNDKQDIDNTSNMLYDLYAWDYVGWAIQVFMSDERNYLHMLEKLEGCNADS